MNRYPVRDCKGCRYARQRGQCAKGMYFCGAYTHVHGVRSVRCINSVLDGAAIGVDYNQYFVTVDGKLLDKVPCELDACMKIVQDNEEIVGAVMILDDFLQDN